MRCYGVWGTVGSTGQWPEVVNMWELNGWEGLAANFEHELSHAGLQDPALAQWWAQAAELRRGGFDRILVPERWTRTIEELCADGVRGVAYAHELVTLPPGAARDYLDALREQGKPAVEDAFGFELIGAFADALVNDSQCVALWAIPDWESWATFEASGGDDERLGPWRSTLRAVGADWRRTLLVDSPLSPMRIGRQPAESDRLPLDEIP